MKVLIFVLAVLFSAVSNSATPIAYENSWDRGWTARAVDSYCHLELELEGYGKARFVAKPDSELGFELQAMRDFQGGPLKVIRATPSWSPNPETHTVVGRLTHIVNGGSIAEGALVQKMFLALRQGDELELHGRSNVPAPLQLKLRAMDFFPAMQTFLDCAHTNVTVAWQGISRTRVTFEVNDHQIDASPELDAVASFLKSHPAVTKVYVDGHTDASGSERANRQLAKRRADSVSAYLQQAGVKGQRIVTRFHGERYPVATNDTVDGRAQNRRVTVRLERQSPTELASQ